MSCVGALDAAVSLEMAFSVVDISLALEIDGALDDHQTTRIALITRLWEQTNCTVEYEDLLEAIEDTNRTALRPVLAALGERDELTNIWDQLQPRLTCRSTLTEGELEAARIISESGTGYPCGWQP